MFEVVFDYGEGTTLKMPEMLRRRPRTAQIVNPPSDPRDWPVRQDPFSSYRAGFEVRTYRLCRRVLMFHHFPDELGDRLTTSSAPPSSLIVRRRPNSHPFITGVTQSGYVRDSQTDSYLKKSLPPLEFEYSQADVQEEVRDSRSAKAWKICLMVLTAPTTNGWIWMAKGCPAS